MNGDDFEYTQDQHGFRTYHKAQTWVYVEILEGGQVQVYQVPTEEMCLILMNTCVDSMDTLKDNPFWCMYWKVA